MIAIEVMLPLVLVALIAIMALTVRWRYAHHTQALQRRKHSLQQDPLPFQRKAKSVAPLLELIRRLRIWLGER
jgi:hypothetical protein